MLDASITHYPFKQTMYDETFEICASEQGLSLSYGTAVWQKFCHTVSNFNKGAKNVFEDQQKKSIPWSIRKDKRITT